MKREKIIGERMETEFCGLKRFGIAAVILLLFSSGAWGQKKQKNQKPDANTPAPEVQSPVSEQIDHDIGEMLGAFQVGNVEAMHKYYAENVTFVSSAYQPPIVGWPNYVASYQQARAAFPTMQLIRRNTNIFSHGDAAWASYQWEFDSTYEGKPYSARGQTTLVFVKMGNDWLIVHNHTSEICDERQGALPQQPALTSPPQNPTSPAPPKP